MTDTKVAELRVINCRSGSSWNSNRYGPELSRLAQWLDFTDQGVAVINEQQAILGVYGNELQQLTMEYYQAQPHEIQLFRWADLHQFCTTELKTRHLTLTQAMTQYFATKKQVMAELRWLDVVGFRRPLQDLCHQYYGRPGWCDDISSDLIFESRLRHLMEMALFDANPPSGLQNKTPFRSGILQLPCIRNVEAYKDQFLHATNPTERKAVIQSITNPVERYFFSVWTWQMNTTYSPYKYKLGAGHFALQFHLIPTL